MSTLTDISYMFYNCENLQSLDVSEFNTINVTNMSNAFYKCKQITNIDVSKKYNKRNKI